MNWVASDTANWIFFGLGVLSAALAVLGALFPISSSRFLRRRRIRLLSFGQLMVWSPAVVGPLLVLGGAVMVGTGAGRLSGLSVFSGATCLLVFAFLRLRRALLDVRDVQEQAASRIHSEFRHVLETYRDLLATYGRLSQPPQPPSPSGIAHAVYRELQARRALLGPSPSEIAEEIHQNLVGKDILPRTVRNIDDFANLMTRTGVWAPASIYTSADDGMRLKDAVVGVLREFGLASVIEEPPVRGSWFQRFWAHGKDVAGSEPVRERLAKLERALELAHLGKPQAEIDKAKAEAVAALYGVLKEQRNAVVHLGSLIMIKTEGDLVVWTIGEMEAAQLERNSELLRDPIAALMFLRDGRRTSVGEDAGPVPRGVLEPPTPPRDNPDSVRQSPIRIFTRAELDIALRDGEDLRGAWLDGAWLDGVDLRQVDLRGVHLKRAHLRGANLRGAQLIEADLSGADLSGADLSWASCHRADLHGANLAKADLTHARLMRANLRATSLLEANMREANLSWANLRGALLSEHVLSRQSLRGGQLEGAGWNEQTTWPDYLANEIRMRSREVDPGRFVVKRRFD